MVSRTCSLPLPGPGGGIRPPPKDIFFYFHKGAPEGPDGRLKGAPFVISVGNLSGQLKKKIESIEGLVQIIFKFF